MADISVEICGVRLESPLILASGNAGYSGEKLRRIAQMGAGAVTTITIYPRETGIVDAPRVSPSRWTVSGIGARSSAGIHVETSRPGIEWFDREMKTALQGGVPVIANICGTNYYETWIPLAKKAEETGASMIEINFNTPHGIAWGMGMATFLKGLVPEIAEQVKKAISVPLIVKLPHLGLLDFERSIPDITRAGADAIVTYANIPATCVDAEAKGKQTVGAGFRWGISSGPTHKAIGLFQVQSVRSMIKGYSPASEIPIIATGGVSCGLDVIEYVMVGANAVGGQTWIPLLGGAGLFKKSNEEIRSWLETHGYESLDEIRGMSLQYIGKEDNKPFVALVDEELCTGCGKCEETCTWFIPKLPPAITVDQASKKAVVDEKLCQGDGWCRSVCPTKAIKLKGWPGT